MASGREAVLTEDRLQAMVRGYYAERGWDEVGRPDGSDLVGIGSWALNGRIRPPVVTGS